MQSSSPSLKHNIPEREREKMQALINVPYKPYSSEMRSRAKLISNTLPHPLPSLTPSSFTPVKCYDSSLKSVDISLNVSAVILRGELDPPSHSSSFHPHTRELSSPPQRWDNIWAPMRVSLLSPHNLTHPGCTFTFSTDLILSLLLSQRGNEKLRGQSRAFKHGPTEESHWFLYHWVWPIDKLTTERENFCLE